MSYRNYGYGAYLPVRMHDGCVEIKFNTGLEQYIMRTRVDTDWCLIKFDLYDTLFVIEDKGIRYVGRTNGSIQGYRISDGLLVFSSGFRVPQHPILKPVGATHNGSVYAAMLDHARMRTVYIPYSTDEFVFNEPFSDYTYMPTAYAESIGSHTRKLTIVSENGEEVNCEERGQWFVQSPFTGICDSSIV